jgi:hypothetical protein
MSKSLEKFYSIFKDGNEWNEKTIIGFMSFAIMVIFAFTDLITGIFGKEIVIHDAIYDSFWYITLGSFGIDGVQKFAGSKRFNKKKDDIPPEGLG